MQDGQRVGYVDMITGVVYVDHVSGKKYSGVDVVGGLTPDLEPPICPTPGQDPVTRAHKRITELYDTVRYLTAPRWKRPLLRILRWFR